MNLDFPTNSQLLALAEAALDQAFGPVNWRYDHPKHRQERKDAMMEALLKSLGHASGPKQKARPTEGAG